METEMPKYTKIFHARLLSPIFEEACMRGLRDYGQEFFKTNESMAGWFRYTPAVGCENGEVDIWVDNTVDSMLMESMTQDFQTLEKKFLTEYKEFKKPCKTLEEFDAKNTRTTCIYNAPIIVLKTLGEIVHKEMKNNADFLTLTTLTIPSIERIAAQEWNQVIDNEITLEEYTKNWGFLACTDVLGKPYSIEHFNVKIKQGKEEIEDFSHEEKKVNEIINKYSEELQTKIRTLRNWQVHRNTTSIYYYRYFQWHRHLFEKTAEELKINYDELLMLSVPEMIDARTGWDYSSEAKERKKNGFSLKQNETDVILYAGAKPEDVLEKLPEHNVVIEGQTAYPGKVTGKARIVRDPNTLKFDEGDVLVASFTAPSFVPLMKKARALVTDEGGILCHAAIVSREMRLPCIVGTGIATRIIKEGTVVTVDANNGRVLLPESKAL